MTKYILQSGGLANAPRKAQKYFNEITRGLGAEPNVLMCFFAQKRSCWEEKFEKYQRGFVENVSGSCKPVFELAMPSRFEQQVLHNDLICLYGGDDDLIRCRMRNFDLPKIWDGKAVAAISAGANMLAKYFWTCDWRECKEGSGVLPIKFIAHFASKYGQKDPRGPIDWEEARAELEIFGGGDLPVHCLEEGDYAVFEK